MYDEVILVVLQLKILQNILDVVLQYEYYIFEKFKNSEKVKDEYEDVEKFNDNVYYVLEFNLFLGEIFGNRYGLVIMCVSNRIFLLKWVGGRVVNYEFLRILCIIYLQEGNL